MYSINRWRLESLVVAPLYSGCIALRTDGKLEKKKESKRRRRRRRASNSGLVDAERFKLKFDQRSTLSCYCAIYLSLFSKRIPCSLSSLLFRKHKSYTATTTPVGRDRVRLRYGHLFYALSLHLPRRSGIVAATSSSSFYIYIFPKKFPGTRVISNYQTAILLCLHFIRPLPKHPLDTFARCLPWLTQSRDETNCNVAKQKRREWNSYKMRR